MKDERSGSPDDEALRPFRTVGEILDEVVRLHEECRSELSKAADDNGDERRRAVLGYLAEREAEQLATIARVRSGDGIAMAPFVQNIPADALQTAFSECVTTGSLDDLIAHYTARGRALSSFYEQLVGSAGPRARPVLEDLAACARRVQSRLREALLDF